MQLQGSCHCKAVRFEVEAPHPVPYNLCYCSICRKLGGSGGFGINLGARAETLKVEGRAHIRSYHAVTDGVTSHCERTFCGECGSALWLFTEEWPELLHPYASAIDTELPSPPERVHLMVGSRANWAAPIVGENDKVFDAYPDESLAAWHERMGMTA